MDAEIRCPRCRGALIREDKDSRCFECGWLGFPPISAIRAQEDLLQAEGRHRSRGPRHADQQI